MSIKREAVDFGVERISFSSAKPVDDVLKIVREQLSSDLAGPALFARLKAATSAQEIEEIVLSVTANGEHDFVSFGEALHSEWMSVYYQKPFLKTIIFTLGNPLLAKEIMKHDMISGLHIPPKMIVQETEDGGTKISWDRPSSIMPGPLIANAEMVNGMQTVDEKLTKLVLNVLAV
ncbi:hypothetical protein BDW22DRAFT_1360759 [Trametopsis cervina]|nr:hypothetical protein BDW22DRAFT_1360759 [Trametopsis cervina]